MQGHSIVVQTLPKKLRESSGREEAVVRRDRHGFSAVLMLIMSKVLVRWPAGDDGRRSRWGV